MAADGQYFGTLRNIYTQLIEHKGSILYVEHMMNNMSANSRFFELAQSVVEVRNNGHIDCGRLSAQELVVVIDDLFRGLTGTDMANWGRQARRKKWQLIDDHEAWTMGEAQRKLGLEISTLQHVIPDSYREYSEVEMHITALIERSGLPKTFFNVIQQRWQSDFKNINTKTLLIDRIRKDLKNLLEGDTNSLFDRWTGFKERLANGVCYTSEDSVWIESGAMQSDKNPKIVAQLTTYHASTNTRLAAPRPLPHRGRGGPRAANINDDMAQDYYGAFDDRCYAVRTVPTEDELQRCLSRAAP